MGIISGIMRACLPSPVKKAIMATTQYPRILTGRMRLLPDFIIIGAQRSGTTSFYNYLVQHPCVVRASRKEIHFFDNAFGKGLNWYRAHFPTRLYRHYVRRAQGKHLITGEASPYYIYHPQVPRRISEVAPDAKLIAFLRNPIDRAYSHYHLKVKLGFETLSFEDAIEQEEERLRGEVEKMLEDETYHSYNHHHFSYLAKGVYVDQLKMWLDFFPPEQMLIIQSENFYANRTAVLNKVVKFLGLPIWQPKEKVYRKLNTLAYPEMKPESRECLVEYFRPHNERLYQFLAKLSYDPIRWE